MSKPRGLGRGLDSLIPTEVTDDMPQAVRPTAGAAIQEVDPAKIVPNPHQPRTSFDRAELQELADSIKLHGIIHPPVVSDLGDGNYELIAGERRVRAATLAGLKTVPVIVRSFDEQQKLELAVLENVQRAELNPIETAVAYRKLASEFNLSLEEIGVRMGKAKSTVANSMRLLQLPKPALDAVASGAISEAHGRTLLGIEDAAKQTELLNHMLNDHWSVRQSEAFVRGEKTSASQSQMGVKPKKGVTNPTHGENALTQELGDFLGTKVTMQSTAKGGRLVIEYYSDEELQRIVETIRPNSD